ncbi:MAG: hypothetical protein Q8P29_01620 [Candidatus Levybacteria bacterium]|nr:hypothetical protein [Candidatus Levybacteria bacterium]MDZ4228152.1 hypothetical protein [Candidatus Levybacteria bacterium]
MDKNKIALASLAMDLKRVAMSYHRGSFAVANRFFDEALKRRSEINKATLKPYLVSLLKDMDNLKTEQDDMKKAEDALLYSTLFQNAALK